MDGKVKWFSEAKGYGFIVGDNEIDYFFGIRDIKGTDLPQKGDTVSFEMKDDKKGPHAISIIIKTKSDTSYKGDDRVKCPSCCKKMIPRLITNRGSIERSVCPFCGEMFKNFERQYGWGVLIFALVIFLLIIYVISMNR